MPTPGGPWAPRGPRRPAALLRAASAGPIEPLRILLAVTALGFSSRAPTERAGSLITA